MTATLALLLAFAQSEALEMAMDASAPPERTVTEEELQRRLAAQPKAVRDLIERRAMCNHWGGEEPYDAERRREIEDAVKDLRCETLRAEETFLRRHFAKHPDMVQLLDDTSDRLGW